MKEKILLKFAPVINEIKKNNYEIALDLLRELQTGPDDEHFKNKLYGSIYFKKKNWLESVKFYNEILKIDKKDMVVLNNLGVALFNLGKFREAINYFEKILKFEKNSSNTYRSLGITYKNIGNYEKAIENFLNSLNLQNNDGTRHSLIDTFNYFIPTGTKNNKIIDINNEIINHNENLKIVYPIKTETVKNFINENFNKLNKFNISYQETQIFRRNEVDLNCDRHFKVFNEFKIIPKYCFNCFKVQVILDNVVDLIKVFLLINKINFKNNNIRKCVVETRNNILGNYKSYIFCRGIEDAEDVLKIISNDILKSGIIAKNIKIKHGCTEFYKDFPNYEKIGINSDKDFKYSKNWGIIENSFDQRYPKTNNIDKKIVGPTHNKINLSDILIIKNWITYAYLINDNSYLSICDHKITKNYLDNLIKDQIKFRQKVLS